MTKAYEIIVAGGGIAGLTAGLYGARLGRRTLVLTGTVPGGHLLSIEKIEGVPGFPNGIPGYDFCPMVQEEATAAGAEFAAGEVDAVTAIGDGFRIRTDSGEYSAAAVIAATGTRLKTLDVPGEQEYTGRGVSHCASCDGPMLRDQHAVVVGGGDSALQEALTLAQYAGRISVLQRGDVLTAQAEFQRRAAAEEKISIRTGVSVAEILGAEAVTGVRCRESDAAAGTVLDATAVFVYIGMQANSACLESLLPPADGGYVATDGRMRSSRRGLFAAGILRRDAAGRAVSSAGDGAAAAISADRYLRDGDWPG